MKNGNSLWKSPLVWGVLASLCFYALINLGVINNQLVIRYMASHPVEFVMTFMFFTGLAFLVLRLLDIFAQNRGLGKPLLDKPPIGQREPISNATEHIERIERLPKSKKNTLRAERTRAALEYVQGSGSATGLEEELKYLADQDVSRAYSEYGLVRMIVWCIPIFGFLGTVIGIALAIASLDPASPAPNTQTVAQAEAPAPLFNPEGTQPTLADANSGEDTQTAATPAEQQTSEAGQPNSFVDSLPKVISGLTVAFDTTAAALALSIILSFAQFFTDRRESRMLRSIDRAVATELSGRFEVPELEDSGEMKIVLKTIRKLGDTVENMMTRQTQLWENSLESVNRRYSEISADVAQDTTDAMIEALTESLKKHSQELAEMESQIASKAREHWDESKETLDRGTEAVLELQQGFREQSTLFAQMIDATGDITSLEARLADNLNALSQSGHFEETVNSLAAAIHLLNGRLSSSHIASPAPHFKAADANIRVDSATDAVEDQGFTS